MSTDAISSQPFESPIAPFLDEETSSTVLPVLTKEPDTKKKPSKQSNRNPSVKALSHPSDENAAFASSFIHDTPDEKKPKLPTPRGGSRSSLPTQKENLLNEKIMSGAVLAYVADIMYGTRTLAQNSHYESIKIYFDKWEYYSKQIRGQHKALSENNPQDTNWDLFCEGAEAFVTGTLMALGPAIQLASGDVSGLTYSAAKATLGALTYLGGKALAKKKFAYSDKLSMITKLFSLGLISHSFTGEGLANLMTSEGEIAKALAQGLVTAQGALTARSSLKRGETAKADEELQQHLAMSEKHQTIALDGIKEAMGGMKKKDLIEFLKTVAETLELRHEVTGRILNEQKT